MLDSIFRSLNFDRFNTVLDISNLIRLVVSIQTNIAVLLFLLGSVAISYGLFGALWSLYSELLFSMSEENFHDINKVIHNTADRYPITQG